MSARVPRALHLLVHSSGGGTETNVRLLCHEIPEFDMLTLEEAGCLPLTPASIRRFIPAARRHEPEVVFCYGVTMHLLAMLAWPMGMPLVGNIRSETDFAGWKGMTIRAVRRRFHPWVSNSRAALAGWPGRVVYNGILPPPEDEQALLESLPRPVLGILARGIPRKGHGFALELWGRLGKPGSLVFAGKLDVTLRRRAEAAGVTCTGFVPAGPLLRSIDLLLVPSSSEGIPTAILEAMVRGVPVLAAPAGGIAEVIRHGENGFLLPRKSWMRFLRSADWASIRRMGEAGRVDVLRRFPFAKMRSGFIAAAREAVYGDSSAAAPS